MRKHIWMSCPLCKEEVYGAPALEKHMKREHSEDEMAEDAVEQIRIEKVRA